MGYVFEELIRVGAEQANEEAGEHFTPREVIRLMVSLLLSPEPGPRRELQGQDDLRPRVRDRAGCCRWPRTTCASTTARRVPHLYGQDWNNEAWAVCRSDMLIKGENAENIILGDSFSRDGYARGGGSGRPSTFDYMLANPPFGVEWKQQEQHVKQERDTLGLRGALRRGAAEDQRRLAAVPAAQCCRRCSQSLADGTGGSRIAIVFNGSPLFTGGRRGR